MVTASFGVDLRCLPTDGGDGSGVAHAARFLTQALMDFEVPWGWKLFVPKGARFSCRGMAPRVRMNIVTLSDASGGALRAAIRREHCSGLFVPSGAVPFGVGVPAIPWVHDLEIYDHPEWFPQTSWQRFVTTTLFRRGVRGATRVCAVSEHTKGEIARRFKIDAARIVVTGEGGDPPLAELSEEELPQAKVEAREMLRALGLSRKFVLVLGTVEPRKNIETAIAVWRKIAHESECDLVIAGQDGWKTEGIHAAIEEVKKSPLGERLHRLEHVDDAMRRNLLLAAETVTVPSFSEGFGLVALEAMQAGTAVVVSTAGALPEVVGEGGRLIDPRAVDGWASALGEVLRDGEARQQLAERGKQRSSEYTWKKSAEVVIGALTAGLGGDKFLV